VTYTLDLDLRASDFTLSEDQHALRETFASFFERECPIDRVRAAEPGGFDDALWRHLLDTGAATMGLPVDRGGDGAGLVELALVTEEHGRRLAPVPLVPVVTAARLLARCDGTDEWLHAAASGERTVVLAMHTTRDGEPQLVAGGALAVGVIGLVGDRLVLATRDEPTGGPRDLGSQPVGWWKLAPGDAGSTELARGADAIDRYEEACREWRLLTAASLVGVSRGALDLAVQYAKDRVAFGVPIGTFQAVAHPLADVAVAIEGARHLVWKAAWLGDHELTESYAAIEMAYLHACRTAVHAATVGIHTQGGFGFTLESDMQLYFRRAKAWPLVAGDPNERLASIAAVLFGPIGAP
jgi:alkylation response protein AidB-like acyl-CoA dehydrogenase